MSVTSKSPLGVAREALAIGSATLHDYAHRFSPKTYTQPQLFACLVLKTFLRTDYRGICRFLKEWAELRTTLRLTKVPHFTTLQKASRRLLRMRRVRRLLSITIKRYYKRKRKIERAALDSTGFPCGHASLYYTRRRTADVCKRPVDSTSGPLPSGAQDVGSERAACQRSGSCGLYVILAQIQA
jgi:hypothetical protein